MLKVIRHENGKWVLYTADGSRVLGRHDTKAEAQAQERAIEANKGVVMPPQMQVYLPFTKVEEQADGSVYVEGIATQEMLDHQGEVVTYDASKVAFAEWADAFAKATDGQSLGNIREMHGPVAAGKSVMWRPDDTSKSIALGALIVDGQAAKKCKQRVYTGFSIGAPGHSVKTDGNRITAYRLSEVSVVDKPACPTAVFSMVKRDIAAPVRKDAAAAQAALTAAFDLLRSALVEIATDSSIENTWIMDQLVSALGTVRGLKFDLSWEQSNQAAETAMEMAATPEVTKMEPKDLAKMVTDAVTAAVALLQTEVAEIKKGLIKAAAPASTDTTETAAPEQPAAADLQKAMAETVEKAVSQATQGFGRELGEVKELLKKLPAPVGRPAHKAIGSGAGSAGGELTLEQATEELAKRMPQETHRHLRLALAAASVKETAAAG